MKKLIKGGKFVIITMVVTSFFLANASNVQAAPAPTASPLAGLPEWYKPSPSKCMMWRKELSAAKKKIEDLKAAKAPISAEWRDVDSTRNNWHDSYCKAQNDGDATVERTAKNAFNKLTSQLKGVCYKETKRVIAHNTVVGVYNGLLELLVSCGDDRKTDLPRAEDRCVVSTKQCYKYSTRY